MIEIQVQLLAQSFLPQIVEKDFLPKANGRLFGVELVANNFLGAPIAGLLIGISLYTPFIADTVLLIISAFFIFSISGNFSRDDHSTQNEKTIDLIKEGVAWLKKQVLLKRLAIYTGLANFFGAMQYPIMVLFAQEILNLNSVQYAFLAYGAAIGGLIGSTLSNKINNFLQESKTLILAMFLFSLGMFLPFVTTNPFIVALAFATTSFGSVMWNVQAVSIRQSIIPDNLLGRVNSVYRLLALGLTPLGAFFGGTVVKYSEIYFDRMFSLRLPFLLAGVAMTLVFITSFKLLSQDLINSTKKNS